MLCVWVNFLLLDRLLQPETLMAAPFYTVDPHPPTSIPLAFFKLTSDMQSCYWAVKVTLRLKKNKERENQYLSAGLG